MTRALRWPVVVRGLLIAAIMLLVAQYLLGLVARSMIVRSGEAAVQASVEMGRARVSLLKRQVVLNNLRLKSGSISPDHVVEVDRCVLQFAAAPFLHKQAIVERGTATGLRFRTSRDVAVSSSPGGRQQQRPSANWFSDGAANRAGDWLNRLEEKFDDDVVRQFESVRRTEQLCASWPQRAAGVKRRMDELNQRSGQLQAETSAAQVNPLRHAAFFNSLPDQIATLQKDFAQASAEAEKLLDTLEAERRLIVASRQRDEEFLRQRLHVEPIDAATLSEYLLAEQAAKPLDEMVRWLRWTRQVVPENGSRPCGGARGQDVVFAGCRPSPQLLIRALQLEGTARIGDQPVELHGLLSDFAQGGAPQEKPIQLRLKATGSMPLEMLATIHRTAAAARDELLVDCRGIVLPKMELGRPNQFRLSLAPSIAALSISVALEGDKLSGDVQLVQRKLQITPALGGELGGVPLAATLADNLRNVGTLATRVSLSGTLDQPQGTLWSNLGPAVAEAMEQALRRTSDQYAQSMLAKSQQLVDKRLTDLERQAADHHAALTAQMSRASGELGKIAVQHTSTKRLSPERLGRRLPTDSLLR